MTPTELLRPRYKVIADYPGCPWNMGRILEQLDNNSAAFDCAEAPCSSPVRYPSKYPAVFTHLEWHMLRKVDDMPEHVKHRRTGNIFKVKQWLGFPLRMKLIGAGRSAHVEDYIPATLEDYNNYQQSKSIK